MGPSVLVNFIYLYIIIYISLFRQIIKRIHVARRKMAHLRQFTNIYLNDFLKLMRQVQSVQFRVSPFLSLSLHYMYYLSVFHKYWAAPFTRQLTQWAWEPWSVCWPPASSSPPRPPSSLSRSTLAAPNPQPSPWHSVVSKQ